MLKISVENYIIFLNVENFINFHNTKLKIFKIFCPIEYDYCYIIIVVRRKTSTHKIR